MIRLLLVALFAAGQVCAQNAENVEGDQPLAAMQRATVFNSTEFNPFSFHLGKWPRQIYSGAYAQLRYEANWFDTEAGQGSDTDSRIRLNRARWFVEGLFTDSLYYKLAFDVSDEQDFFLQQAILKFSLPDNSRLWVGKMFYNSLREDWPDPTQTASMDNSAMDYTFGLGTSLGLMWQSNQTDRTRWWLTLNNSDVGSRSPNAEAGETDVTLYGRFDYQIAGTDWSVWDDLIGRRGLPFGVLLGLTAGHMRNGERDSGFEEDTTQLGMDLSVNGDGYQVVLAGTWNNVSATDIIDYYNYGAYFQAAYFFLPKWQGYVRYDYVSPGDQVGDLESYRAPGIGVNFFPIKNIRWRVTAELNYLFSAFNKTIVESVPELGWVETDEKGQTSFRVQLQLGF